MEVARPALRFLETPCRHEQETYHVIGDRETWCRVFGPARHQPEVDFRRHVVLHVAWGLKPTGGYSIRIRGVEKVAARAFRVWVEKREPGPGDFVTMIQTYPQDVVLVRREDTGLAGLAEFAFVEEVLPAAERAAGGGAAKPRTGPAAGRGGGAREIHRATVRL